MKILPLMLFGLYGILVVDLVSADCIRNRAGDVVCEEGKCKRDRKGNVYCTELGGGILSDNGGNMFCGVGECAEDGKGDIWCSRIQGGGAATDSKGDVKCYGGCERGSKSRCVPGK